MNILSLGAVAMDVVLNSSDLAQNDGFSLVYKETVLPGGSASNVSVAAASLGMNPYQTGKIGDDEYGKKFLETLLADQVNADYLVTRQNGTTLHTYILTTKQGEHCIFANLGNCVGTLLPEELPAEIMNQMDLFYTDLFSGEAARWLSHQAKEQRKPVIYNMQCTPAFMQQCGTTMEQIEQVMTESDLIVSGKDGYLEYTKTEDYKEAVEMIFQKYHPQSGVICTLGAKGAAWYNGQWLFHPGYQIVPVDSTGAGDCFVAGILYGYYQEKMGREQALDFASATAAVKCLQEGPRSRATKDEIIKFMRTF